jgi:hypothetical protein
MRLRKYKTKASKDFEGLIIWRSTIQEFKDVLRVVGDGTLFIV